MKAKILFPFTAQNQGGSIISAINLAKSLSDANYDIIFLVHGDGPAIKLIEKKKINYLITNIKFFENGENFFNFLFKLITQLISMIFILFKIRPDIVHINDSRMVNTWTLVSKLLGFKVVIHQRTKPSKSKFLEFNLSKANYIIAISKFIENEMFLFGYKKIKLIYNQFYENNYRDKEFISKIDKILDYNENDFIVGYFANFSNQKRASFFVDIALRLKELKNIKFLMFGKYTSQEIKRFKLLINRAKHKYIFIQPYTDKVNEVLEKFDVLICPSVNEGFGRTIVEASLVKTMTIASNSGAHKEIIKNYKNGILLEKDDISSFCESIIYLKNNRNELEKMSANAFKINRKKYDSEVSLRQVIEVYNKIS